MKGNKSLVLSLGLLIAAASLYRVWDGRPWGFAPQIAMAVFGGAVIKDKKLAFLLPLLSMLLSDALYQVLYMNGWSQIPGFYNGQVTNYILFGALTVFGFWARNLKWMRIIAASLAAPTAYFLVSNFLVWFSGGGLHRPKTFGGLMLCYNDALLFYKANQWTSTLFFAGVLFGGYYLITKYWLQPKQQLV